MRDEHQKSRSQTTPTIQQIIFAGRHEPLARVGELKRQHAALVQIKLVFVLRLCAVQHLYVTAFHADRQPIASRTVAKRKYLTREIVLRLLEAGPVGKKRKSFSSKGFSGEFESIERTAGPSCERCYRGRQSTVVCRLEL